MYCVVRVIILKIKVILLDTKINKLRQSTLQSSTITVPCMPRNVNGQQNKDTAIASKWRLIVRAERKIHRWDLKDRLGISINDYYRFTSYVLYKYGDELSYDKKSQVWFYEGEDMEVREIMEAKPIA